MERYQSPDGKVLLYKPADWTVSQEPMGEGAFALSVTGTAGEGGGDVRRPYTGEEIKDSVAARRPSASRP